MTRLVAAALCETAARDERSAPSRILGLYAPRRGAHRPVCHRVMRGEHEQMRGLLMQMALVAISDVGAALDQGDTLLMLMQQHNTKEEGMLYPMAEARLTGAWAGLAAKLARY